MPELRSWMRHMLLVCSDILQQLLPSPVLMYGGTSMMLVSKAVMSDCVML
jgi:hypothetical protein